MSNLEVMHIHVPRHERAMGLRWLRGAMRAVLLSLHQSRRRQARRIVRETRHLLEQGRDDGTGQPKRK